MRELRSKLAGLSGSRASMLIVRQLMLAMLANYVMGLVGICEGGIVCAGGCKGVAVCREV